MSQILEVNSLTGAATIESAAPLNLLKFCRLESGKYEFESPFVMGGWKYATDSRICVRIKTDEPDTEGRNLPPRDFNEGLFEGWPAEGKPWPKSQDALCGKCGGDGIRRCQSCGHSEPDKQCERCQGRGSIAPEDFKLGLRSIRGNHDSLIRALPNPKWYPRSEDEQQPHIRFGFEGGQGVLMPKLEER